MKLNLLICAVAVVCGCGQDKTAECLSEARSSTGSTSAECASDGRLPTGRVAFVREHHGSVVLERPAPLGLDAGEYKALTAFADDLIFAKARPCTECASRVLYCDDNFFSMGVWRSRTGEPSALKKMRDFGSEYGCCRDEFLLGETRLATFARRLGRRLAFDDVFVSEALPVIRKAFAGELSRLATDTPFLTPGAREAFEQVDDATFRACLENFAMEATAIRFMLPTRLIGVADRCLDWSLPLDACRGILREGFALPREARAPQGAGTDGRFAYDRLACTERLACAAGIADCLSGGLSIDIEYPVAGFPASANPAAVAAFVATVLTRGEFACTNVEAAVSALKGQFRKACATDEAKARKEGAACGGSRFDSCKGRILFMNGQYLSYRNAYQHHCTCGMGVTNGVFGFAQNRALTSGDFLRPSARDAVLRLLWRQVEKDMDLTFEFSDYGKNCPKTLEEFSVDGNGITWHYDAGEVMVGGKGPAASTLTWEQLKPYLVSPAVVPSNDGTPQSLVNWELLKISDE